MNAQTWSQPTQNLWRQVKTFVFCVPTCVQVCAPLHTCTAVGFRPSDREYTGSFSGPRIAVNGWQRGQQPTHSVRGLAGGWLHWQRPVNRLSWRDLSRSQSGGFVPVLPSKMRRPRVWFWKQASNWGGKGLFSLFSNQNLSEATALFAFLTLRCRVLLLSVSDLTVRCRLGQRTLSAGWQSNSQQWQFNSPSVLWPSFDAVYSLQELCGRSLFWRKCKSQICVLKPLDVS